MPQKKNIFLPLAALLFFAFCADLYAAKRTDFQSRGAEVDSFIDRLMAKISYSFHMVGVHFDKMLESAETSVKTCASDLTRNVGEKTSDLKENAEKKAADATKQTVKSLEKTKNEITNAAGEAVRNIRDKAVDGALPESAKNK